MEFVQIETETGAGETLPIDQNDTIGLSDNVLSAFQPFGYNSNYLIGAGVLPPHEDSYGHVTLVVDWSANSPVYPLVGGVTRHKQVIGEPFPELEGYPGELVGGLGRSSHPCTMIHTVYGK